MIPARCRADAAALVGFSLLPYDRGAQHGHHGMGLGRADARMGQPAYPMGFYTKWMDGRIDDPGAGWKGRGVWATTGTRAPFHMEGGKGTRPKVVKFQLRPDPLAR